MINETLHITNPAAGVSITTIAKTMNKNIFQSKVPCHIAQSIKVFIKRMNTAIREKSQKMNLFILITGIGKCIRKNRILFNITCFALLVYLNQILINNSSGTNIEMSYLRISHLSIG